MATELARYSAAVGQMARKHNPQKDSMQTSPLPGMAVEWRGLSTGEAERPLAQYGPNDPAPSKTRFALAKILFAIFQSARDCAATKLSQRFRYWLDKRRDESRRGTHECARHRERQFEQYSIRTDSFELSKAVLNRPICDA